MDLRQPLPPLFRHHHQQFRYDNVLHSPDFFPPPYPRRQSPLPPPPQSLPPHIILPPSSAPHPPPARHIAHPFLPPHFTFCPPHHPIIERSRLHDFDLPPKPYFDRPVLLPPPPQPPPPQPLRENVHFRIIHDYPERNPIFRDENFRGGCLDDRIHELPENWGRNLQLDCRELHSKVPNIVTGEHGIYSDNFYQSRGLCIKRDDGEIWDNEIRDWGRDLYNRRDYDERRWDTGMNDQRHEFYNERDCAERRWDNHMNVQRLEFYSEREYDKRRWDIGNNSGGCELYCEGGEDERSWGSGSNGSLLQLENRQLGCVEDGLGRFRGRLRRGANKGKVNRSNKNRKLQKNSVFHRIQLGEDCSRRVGDIEHRHIPKKLNRGSFKGKEKDIEGLQTRTEDKRKREQSPMELAISFKSNALVAKAILTPSHPAVKSDVKSMSVNKRLGYGLSGSPLTNSNKECVMDLDSDSQKTPKDLQDKAAAPESGSMIGNDFSDSCKINMQVEKNNDCIMNTRDCSDIRFSGSQLKSDATLSKDNLSSAFVGGSPGSLPSLGGTVSEKADIGGYSCNVFVPKLKRKRMSLTTRPAYSCEAENVISEPSDHAERLITTAEDADHVLQLGADEVACHAHEKPFAIKSTSRGDSLDFNQHMNSVDNSLHDRASVLGAEKGALESVGQYAKLGCDWLDGINEGPSEVTLPIEGHDTAGLSRPQETRTLEVHEVISSPKSDSAATQALEDLTIFYVGSCDANTKGLFPNHLNVPQVGVDPKEFKSLECAVGGCSNFGLGISTSSDFLSADYKRIIPKSDVSFPVALGTNLSTDIDSTEGSPEVSCVDRSSKIIRKRKAGRVQMDLSGKKTDLYFGTDRSIGGEMARGLADLVPAMEVDILGEKDSCKEDDSLEGRSRVEDSIPEVDCGARGSLPGCQKKRKLPSPKLSLSSLSEDGSIEDALTANPPILDQLPTELLERGADQREETSRPSAATNQCDTTSVEGRVGTDSSVIVNLDNNLDDGNRLHWNGDLASIANNISLCTDRNGDYASDASDELFVSGFDMRSCMSSPEQLLVSDLNITGKSEASACLSDSEMICGSDKKSNEKPVPSDPNICSLGKSLDAAAVKYLQTHAGISSPQLDTSQVIKKLNPVYGKKLTWSRNQLNSSVPRVIPGHPPSNFSNSRKLYPIHATKSRTWHRTGTSAVVAEAKMRPPVPPSHGTKAAKTTQSSYVRKGNSLVRNPSLFGVTPPICDSSSSVYRPTPCKDTTKNSQISDQKTFDADAPTIERIEQVNISEMTKASTLNCSEKPLSCSESSPAGNPSRSSSSGKTLDSREERIQASPVTECRTDSLINSNRSTVEGNSEKKIMYVKRKSNQLVATSSSDDTCKIVVDKDQVSSSGGYYKRRRNQLVRATCKNHFKRGEANGNAVRLVAHSILPKISNRRQSGVAKTCRYSKFSMVWKLHAAQSSDKDKNTLGPQKARPHLFSSKRAACWRRLILGTKSDSTSFSTLSQKLLLARKRGAIYTRSIHGYSLRMSKVLSVGGSSLKWSKSIERNSKKANEEATRAVAAAGKRKKEAVPVVSKSRNHVSSKLVPSVKLRPGTPTAILVWHLKYAGFIVLQNDELIIIIQGVKRMQRARLTLVQTYCFSLYLTFGVSIWIALTGERIFRIGSERYKMDPTRRTLLRITEKEPSSSITHQSEKNVRRSYIPRRLIIGNEEYVRIGNGNQLVRDPKKRTRVLASEKVRWSLRTARLRLARKRKYCQFFTRYGKCNKDGGKCPYIHDPSKIAVCTKFLNGSCSNADCKLTHKVIPERMQDCSYFLKGSCSNENCPYRHVNVDPDSTVCESFLRGYCAEGNECRKKHTYVCPAFESTGICSQASTCKLHHPKKKAEKKPTINEQKIVRGRYFDGGLIGLAESSEATAEKLSLKGNVDVFDGNHPDFISLDVSDDELDIVL